MTRIIEQDAPRARLAVLLQHFSDLDDSREPWRVMYPLKEVLLLVTCATIASCDDFDEIADWGEHNLDFLRRFLDYHHGIPCERWLRYLFNRVDPTLFAHCFENWVAAQWPGRHEFIAIDGKTARRTHDRRNGLKALHTLSAYATAARLTLAQLSVPEKTNEITAIPDLLDHLAETGQLEGALVTIDAMGCQVDIAEKIITHKAEYLLALKGNQPNLEAEVTDYFCGEPNTEARSTGSLRSAAIRASRASPASRPSSRSTAVSSMRIVPPPTHGTSSARLRSTSTGSPKPHAVIGASKACIGCSMSNSAMTCHATEPATVPGTWPLYGALPSISFAPKMPREASRHDESEQAGIPPSSSKYFKSNEN
jgi:predicted transposase YbfD/YdcC